MYLFKARSLLTAYPYSVYHSAHDTLSINAYEVQTPFLAILCAQGPVALISDLTSADPNAQLMQLKHCGVDKS